jgi:DNA-binding PadR family transcriptional regulator
MMSRGLGEFEQLLLFAVLRLGNEAYGVRIRQEIAAQTGKDVAAGAVYTGLDRLQARGFVSSEQAESAPSRGGRRRKYYRLQPEGALALEATYTNVRAMAEGALDALRDVAAEAEQGAGR